MSALGGALPTYPDFANQRYPTSSSPSTLQYQMPGMHQYANAPSHSGVGTGYTMAYSQYQGQYPSGHVVSPQNPQAGVQSGGQFYNAPGYMGTSQQQGQQFYIQPNQYVPQSSAYPAMPGSGQFSGRSGYAVDPRLQVQQRSHDFGPPQGFGAQGRSNSVGKSQGRSLLLRELIRLFSF